MMGKRKIVFIAAFACVKLLGCVKAQKNVEITSTESEVTENTIEGTTSSGMLEMATVSEKEYALQQLEGVQVTLLDSWTTDDPENYFVKYFSEQRKNREEENTDTSATTYVILMEYPEIDNEKVKVIQKNEKEPQNEINLILEDTYVIKNSQIPYSKRNLFTIKISRNGGSNGERHYSEAFMEKIISTVKGLENTSVVNVYATTNPLHTKYIAERVFKSGGRGDIRKLYVYQQNRDGDRNFEDRGHRIY